MIPTQPSFSTPKIPKLRAKKTDLRDHAGVATGAHANDRAGHREHLISTRRAVVGSHFEKKRKKKKKKKGRDGW